MKYGVEVIIVHENIVSRIVEAETEEEARAKAEAMVTEEGRWSGRVAGTRRCGPVFVQPTA